jgi:PAS domain S-box-containing protein
MIVRLAGHHDRVGAAMAFMLALFGVAVAALSRSGGRAISEALVLRFRNEALVDGLRATQERLESANATLERRVGERTAELERTLGLRVRAEEALRHSEQRLRELADSMHPLAWTARPDGHVTWYNRRWYDYTGTTPEEVEGWGWQAVHEPAALPEVLRRWKDAIARGATLEMEVRLRGADGGYRSFLTHVFPLKDRAGAVTQWFGTHSDVTELVEARELLRRSDRQKGQFIAVLSHELRNPLAAIRSSLYLFEHSPPESPTFERAREIVQRQTAHLTRLVDDLLDVARISRGTIELRLQRADASEIVRRVCDDYRASFHDRRLELRTEIAGPAWVDGDPTRLAQVVGNLLHNAMKFSREGGAVVVRVDVGEGRVLIRVRDEGVGIPPELLPRLFEPFTQPAGGPPRTNAGLGLGLALAHAIVELHGGSVRAESEGRDRGAELVVTLPLAAAPARPDAAPEPAPAAPAAARGALVVLVVEDNVDTAQSIAEVLAIEGHQVHVATDARSGIAQARELRPDVVLCDIGLPDADGHEVARTLRADGALRATRLIALSGYAQPEDRERAAEAGFDEHVAKPVPIDVLLAALHRGRD